MGNGIYCKGAENFEEKSPRSKPFKRRAEVKHPSAVLRRVEILLSVQVKKNVVTKREIPYALCDC